MNNLLKITLSALVVLSLAACGSGAKDKKGDINDLKVKLEKLKKEKSKLDTDIKDIENKIAEADPEAAKKVKKLVSVDTLRVQDFVHFIELQGKINSDGVGYVAPKGGGGVVRAIYVKIGQRVSRGQVVAKLDDAIAQQQLAAAQQQGGVLKARLDQAKTVYEKYQNLWKQNIGAEINVINAKADVDALTAQLKAAEAGVAQAKEAVDMSNVRAGMNGVVDQVNVRLGEYFSGVSPDNKPQIAIVSTTGMKVEVPVPDNYAASVKKGDKVEVVVAETGKPPYKSVISAVGAAIDPNTRSFIAEAKLPSDPQLKPNQTALMKILDYESKATVVVPVNVVQTDDKGKYVYVAEKKDDKMVARKKAVNAGQAYNGMMEIKGGLSGGDIIITEGYQSVYDGQTISTAL
ncbi:MAG: efflux RND transporter periplasmic adaptor subunit [Chitinophagaceae bacterium]|nr:efflux RND transporter periplasmic adaptor subunit [Chitinophagaceae bacterium]MCB9054753.1 efflux RND transporter periplasmic adaptor subunit [Chitinophagales bacterium]